MADQTHERLSLIRDHARELRDLAQSSGHGLLAYLLNMAFVEATLQMSCEDREPDEEKRQALV